MFLVCGGKPFPLRLDRGEGQGEVSIGNQTPVFFVCSYNDRPTSLKAWPASISSSNNSKCPPRSINDQPPTINSQGSRHGFGLRANDTNAVRDGSEIAAQMRIEGSQKEWPDKGDPRTDSGSCDGL